jgi:DNA-binding CsgD family transcriptional regulator
MNELLNTPLSERELEILKLVAQGKANKEIAAELYISVNTVKVHLAKIFQRIGVASRTEATLYAIEHEHVENPNHSLVNPQDQQVESRVELVVPEMVTVERAFVKLSVADNIRKFWWAFGIGFLVLASFTVAWDRGWIFPKPTPDPILAAMNEDRWKELAPMSVARANMAVTVYDYKIYVIGGETEEGVTGLTEVYDIATDTWARLPDKPTPVTNAKAVVVGGKIYVPGGRDFSGLIVNNSEVFDLASISWEKSQSLPEPVENYGLANWNGNLYLFGGNDDKRIRSEILIFDPHEGQWSNSGNLPIAMKQFSISEQSDAFYFFGGTSEAGYVNNIYRLFPIQQNIVSTAWKVVGKIPSLTRISSSTITEFQTILLQGEELQDLLFVNDYDDTQSWSKSQIKDSGSCSSMQFVYFKGVVYLIGGFDVTSNSCKANIALPVVFYRNLPVIIR